jgi:hypothetical protein
VYIDTLKLVRESIGSLRLDDRIEKVSELRAKGFTDEEIEILLKKYMDAD